MLSHSMVRSCGRDERAGSAGLGLQDRQLLSRREKTLESGNTPEQT